MKPIQVLALLSGLSALTCAVQTQGQTLNNLNSTVNINPITQSGMNSWTINGQQEMTQQWFWYSVGSTAPASIDTLALTGDTLSGGSAGQLQYASLANNFTVSINYTLSGTAPGTYVSDVGEQISIQNNNASPLTMEFYKYTDFDLQAGQGGLNTVEMSQNLFTGLWNDAYQFSAHMTAASEIGVVPGSTLAEAALLPQTLSELNNGSTPVVLNDNAVAGPGAVTSAFQWDLTIPGLGTAVMSTDDIVQSVPEPSVFGLITAGGLALSAWQRRRGRV